MVEVEARVVIPVLELFKSAFSFLRNVHILIFHVCLSISI